MSRAEATRSQLERIFRAAVAAADPGLALGAHVRVRADGGLVVAGEALAPGARVAMLALGKAAFRMAAVFASLAGPRLGSTLAVAPAGAGVPPPGLRALESAHPVPDERSERAARAALDFVASLAPEETLVVLLSGGTSSLLSAPAPGLTPADLADTTRALLASGAPIEALNAVRKHLSAVSGGRLAAATRAGRLLVLVVSDVSGDRLDVIGSGPFAPDPTRYADAREVLDARGLWDRVPESVRRHLAAGAAGARPETPSAPDPRVRHLVIAANATALAGAVRAARAEGLSPLLVTDRLRGEARVAGRRLATLARSLRSGAPRCLLAGGETTVTVTGSGRGGRSQELALAAALALTGSPDGVLLAAGTDGCDGPTDAAGAFADGQSVARGAAAGADARVCLGANDAYGFFDREGGLLRTGPTGTNVMDLVLIRTGAAG